MLVGLTGGIGTGKSTVAHHFAMEGFQVVSADELGHQVMQPDGEAYEEIIDRFNYIHGMVNDDGTINRKVLGAHVFDDFFDLEDLEAIVHPAVGKKFQEYVEQHPDQIIIYECAILFENDIDTDYTIATWCPEELQISRIMKRDNIDYKEASKRIQKQMPAKVKVELADFDIDTSDEDYVRRRVDVITRTLYDLREAHRHIAELLVGGKLIGSYQDQQK